MKGLTEYINEKSGLDKKQRESYIHAFSMYGHWKTLAGDEGVETLIAQMQAHLDDNKSTFANGSYNTRYSNLGVLINDYLEKHKNVKKLEDRKLWQVYDDALEYFSAFYGL